ncbi:MAG: hypothetical protein V1929_07125 [bacterium]
MIHIIGLNHRYQFEGPGNDWETFYAFLTQHALTLHPDLLAEELDEECILNDGARNSVARRVATEQAARHLFVDPDTEERRRCGIKGYREIALDLGYGCVLTREQDAHVKKIEKRHWDKRERIWLARLALVRHDRCIMIIGANHVARFSRKLSRLSIASLILESDFGTSPLKS